VTLIHGTWLTVVHTHVPPLVVTLMVTPAPPPAAAGALNGLTVKVHGDDEPLCVTV
jgi:hypothetical protein